MVHICGQGTVSRLLINTCYISYLLLHNKFCPLTPTFSNLKKWTLIISQFLRICNPGVAEVGGSSSRSCTKLVSCWLGLQILKIRSALANHLWAASLLLAGALLPHQVASPFLTQHPPEQGVSSHRVFYVLTLEVMYHQFCHVLVVTGQPW